ncbi:MAG TPA: PDZ domain-containing protein [Candidatus Binataceae bacterium]|nr:PDZ domain-containing protein [Candidatus Binataceae bacterium]
MPTRGQIVMSFAIASVLAAASGAARGGSAQNPALPSIAPQSEAVAKAIAPAPQALATSAPTLELEPQPAVSPRSGTRGELAVDRAFKQSQERAALDRNFHPHLEEQFDRQYRESAPYLGIEVQYTAKCFRGMEEHGLEVIKVQPNGPAAHAGLQAQDNQPKIPSDDLIDLLRHTMGGAQEGDLIVAVDDVRIHGREDWEAAIRKLRPGDTVYLTVIRLVHPGDHRTLKIAVRVGRTRVAKPVKPDNLGLGRLAETGTFSY